MIEPYVSNVKIKVCHCISCLEAGWLFVSSIDKKNVFCQIEGNAEVK